MNAKKVQIIAKKTTALLSAIAASSFLGLPVFAQINSNQPSRSNETTGASVYERNSQTSQAPMECVPITSQTDRSTMGTSAMTGSGDRLPADSANPAVQQFPNQSDPRAVAPADGSNIGSTDAAGNITGSVNDQSTVQTGDLPFGSATSQSRVSTQTITTPVAPTGQLSQGGVGGPVDGSATRTDSSTQTTGIRSSADVSTVGSSVNPLYGNVLGRGGSTTGGGALRILQASTNPDWRLSDNNRDNNRVSYGYGQIQGDASQLQTSGVTSGGQAINQSSTAAELSQPGMNQTGASSQSSQGTTGDRTAINCPPGMVPRQSSTLNQQYPGSPSGNVNNNQIAPGRALPNERQNPGVGR